MVARHLEMKAGDALMIIDVQKDFCFGGKLAIQNGEQVVPLINEWVQKTLEKRIPIFASRDWHPQSHISFEEEGGSWPAHCIQDSEGAKFHDDLNLTQDTVIITKGVRFDKDQDSAFDETGLADFLHRKKIDRLFVCGLALDECVLLTAMDAVHHGIGVSLLLAATRPVDYDKGAASVEQMKKAGVSIIGNYPAWDPEQEKASLASENEAQVEPEVCTKAPEWAEHQRFEDEDLTCDDGRSGKIR